MMILTWDNLHSSVVHCNSAWFTLDQQQLILMFCREHEHFNMDVVVTYTEVSPLLFVQPFVAGPCFWKCRTNWGVICHFTSHSTVPESCKQPKSFTIFNLPDSIGLLDCSAHDDQVLATGIKQHFSIVSQFGILHLIHQRHGRTDGARLRSRHSSCVLLGSGCSSAVQSTNPSFSSSTITFSDTSYSHHLTWEPYFQRQRVQMTRSSHEPSGGMHWLADSVALLSTAVIILALLCHALGTQYKFVLKFEAWSYQYLLSHQRRQHVSLDRL